MKKFLLIMVTPFFLGMVLTGGVSFAGELRYTPVNPNFGGSPFNGANLLNQANAINDFKDPSIEDFDFEQSLQDRLDSLVLSQIVSQIVGNSFDSSGNIASGQFNTGVNLIDVSTSGGVTTIVITNVASGETTTIQLPTF